MRKIFLLALLFSGIATAASAQGDSLMNMLDANSNTSAHPAKEYTYATFKATRIINGSSVENLGAGVLDFRISHRFGDVSQGASNFFGLDDATTRIGLDYGITNWLMIGLGHSTLYKEDDGFVKIKLLRQAKHSMPITLSYMGDMSVDTRPAPLLPSYDSNKWFLSNRLYYSHQLLIARKFNERLSLQLMPTIIHYNLVDSSKYSNNTVALGVGGRIKLNKRIAVTAEYYYRLTNTDLTVGGLPTYNAFSVGIDIETGGHVFQLMLTNCTGMTERSFIGETTESWGKGNIHIGFNISRVFTIVKPKEFRDDGKW